MAFGPKRVIRPLGKLPRAIIPDKVDRTKLPSFREFIAEFLDMSNRFAGDGALGMKTFPLAYPADEIQVSLPPVRSGPVAELEPYNSEEWPTPNYYPASFGLAYDMLACRLDQLFNTDDQATRTLVQRHWRNVHVQCVTVDPVTQRAMVKITPSIALTQSVVQRLAKRNVGKKLFALTASQYTQPMVYPVVPHLQRLVGLLDLYKYRYGVFPEPTEKRVNRYEKPTQT